MFYAAPTPIPRNPGSNRKTVGDSAPSSLAWAPAPACAIRKGKLLSSTRSRYTAMHGYEALLNAFLTLIVILDPPGNAPLFLGLTTDMTKAQRFQVALRGSIIAFVILTVFAIAGSGILSAFGITIDAFRVAGGLLLFWIASEMIFERRTARKQQSVDRSNAGDHVSDIAAFPLAIPLIAGPGSISAVVLLSTTFSSPVGRLELVAIIFVAIAILFATLAIANSLDRFLGQTGRAVLIRLLGVLLAALSVQYVADGTKALFSS